MVKYKKCSLQIQCSIQKGLDQTSALHLQFKAAESLKAEKEQLTIQVFIFLSVSDSGVSKVMHFFL